MKRAHIAAFPAVLALLAVVSGCRSEPLPPTPSTSADCIDLPGEEIGQVDWSPSGKFLVIKSRELAKPVDVRQDRVRLLNEARTLTDIVATKHFLGDVTVDDAGTVWWTDLHGPQGDIYAQSPGGGPMLAFSVTWPIGLWATTDGLQYATSNEDGTENVFWLASQPKHERLFATHLGRLGRWVSPDGSWTVLGDISPDGDEDMYTIRHDGSEQAISTRDRWTTVLGMTPDRTSVIVRRVDQDTIEFGGILSLPVDGSPPKKLSVDDALAFRLSDGGAAAYAGFRLPASSKLCFRTAAEIGL